MEFKARKVGISKQPSTLTLVRDEMFHPGVLKGRCQQRVEKSLAAQSVSRQPSQKIRDGLSAGEHRPPNIERRSEETRKIQMNPALQWLNLDLLVEAIEGAVEELIRDFFLPALSLVPRLVVAGLNDQGASLHRKSLTTKGLLFE